MVKSLTSWFGSLGILCISRLECQIFYLECNPCVPILTSLLIHRVVSCFLYRITLVLVSETDFDAVGQTQCVAETSVSLTLV